VPNDFNDTKSINKGMLIFVCPLKGHNIFFCSTNK